MHNDQAGSPAYDAWERALQDGAYEETLEALREVVARLESGRLRLNDAIRCYEFGSLLAKRCERLLDEAELRVSRLDADDEADGEPSGE